MEELKIELGPFLKASPATLLEVEVVLEKRDRVADEIDNRSVGGGAVFILC